MKVLIDEDFFLNELICYSSITGSRRYMDFKVKGYLHYKNDNF